MNVMFRGTGREIGTTLVAPRAPGLGGMRCWLDTHNQVQRERATKRNERDMGAGESTCSASQDNREGRAAASAAMAQGTLMRVAVQSCFWLGWGCPERELVMVMMMMTAG